MPNRPKEPHAIDPRKLPSGRWKGRVQYWDPDTGKRKEITQTFASPREAKKWIRETEQRFKTHTRPPTDETFAAFMARWLVHHATQLRDTTAADYQIQAKKATDVLGVKRLKTSRHWIPRALYSTHGRRVIQPECALCACCLSAGFK